MTTSIESKIWINKKGKPFVGKGKVALLKKVAETQSLSAAAKALSISYRKAWGMLASLNKNSDKLVTFQKIGGKNGGGTELTEYGHQLIWTYEELVSKCESFLEQETKNISI
jgi:molybdate transport system regulatory protein